MTVTRGPKHTYIGMDIEFMKNGEVKILMKDYLTDFTEDCSRRAVTPAANHLFRVNKNAETLDEDDRKLLHSITAKLLFVLRRARPDIQVAIAFLTSRVTKADRDDWKKLKRVCNT
eukprot:scaffold17566_cov108-Cylindrotheca_fusiformis.AAC.1